MNNTIQSNGAEQAIELLRTENCVIEGNQVEGFETQVYAEDCDGEVKTDLEIIYNEK